MREFSIRENQPVRPQRKRSIRWDRVLLALSLLWLTGLTITDYVEHIKMNDLILIQEDIEVNTKIQKTNSKVPTTVPKLEIIEDLN